MYTIDLPRVEVGDAPIGELRDLRWPANARLAASLDRLCAQRATMGDQGALLDALAALSTADRLAAHRALDKIAQAADTYAHNFAAAVASVVATCRAVAQCARAPR